MATYYDSLQRAAFAGIPFPYQSISIVGALRHSLHRYRQTPGASIEPQGRELYIIQFSATFDETLNATTLPGGTKGYPGLYPAGLNSLRMVFEEARTDDLIVPTMGTIAAKMIGFEQHSNVLASLSGERVELKFLEDQEKTYLIDHVLAAKATASIESAKAAIDLKTELLVRRNVGLNIFDRITDAVNGVLAVRDQGSMYASLVASKALALAGLCQEADRTVEMFQHPENHELLDALKELWASANDLANNTKESFAPVIRTYTVPRTMTIQEVSTAIYGRTDKSFDLLSLNDFEDAFRIPAASNVRYYADAT